MKYYPMSSIQSYTVRLNSSATAPSIMGAVDRLFNITILSGCTPWNVQREDKVMSSLRLASRAVLVVLTIRIGTTPGVNKNREK